jgi:hypothetical protein
MTELRSIHSRTQYRDRSGVSVVGTALIAAQALLSPIMKNGFGPKQILAAGCLTSS